MLSASLVAVALWAARATLPSRRAPSGCRRRRRRRRAPSRPPRVRAPRAAAPPAPPSRGRSRQREREREAPPPASPCGAPGAPPNCRASGSRRRARLRRRGGGATSGIADRMRLLAHRRRERQVAQHRRRAEQAGQAPRQRRRELEQDGHAPRPRCARGWARGGTGTRAPPPHGAALACSSRCRAGGVEHVAHRRRRVDAAVLLLLLVVVVIVVVVVVRFGVSFDERCGAGAAALIPACAAWPAAWPTQPLRCARRDEGGALEQNSLRRVSSSGEHRRRQLVDA